MDLDFKGKDWNSQIKYGHPGFYGEYLWGVFMGTTAAYLNTLPS